MKNESIGDVAQPVASDVLVDRVGGSASVVHRWIQWWMLDISRWKMSGDRGNRLFGQESVVVSGRGGDGRVVNAQHY